MFDKLLRRESTAAMPPGTPRILLIDDNKGELALVKDALSHAKVNYQVDWASSYEEGLDRLAQGEYEVGLVDYGLGSWNGLDVLRAARDRKNRVPLILFTGMHDPTIDQAASGLGAVDFLQKGKTSNEEFERAVRFAAANGRALQTARKAEDRMAALEEIGQLLAADGTSADALDSVVGLVSDRLDRGYVSLYLVEGDHFRLAGQRGHSAALTYVERGGFLLNALRLRKAWVVPNQSADPDLLTHADPPMELSIPLLEGNEIVGLMFVGYPENEPITDGEHAALVSATIRIADAIGLAHDRREVSGRSMRMRRIGGFLADLSSTTTKSELELRLAAVAAGVVDAQGVLIGVAADAEHLTIVSSFGAVAAAPGSTVVSDPIARRALLENRPASVLEPQPAGLDARSAGPDRWSAAIPLCRAGRAFGVIQFSRPERPFDIFEREAATYLATLIGLLLSNRVPEA